MATRYFSIFAFYLAAVVTKTRQTSLLNGKKAPQGILAGRFLIQIVGRARLRAIAGAFTSPDPAAEQWRRPAGG